MTAIVALVAVLAVVAEIAAFGLLTWWGRPPSGADVRRSLAMYRDQPWADAYWNEVPRAIAALQYRPYVGWRRRPFSGQTVNVDDAGRRRTEHSRCDAHTDTIFMFGGTTLWGYGSPDGETIPSQLAARFRTAGRPVCIHNYGEPGWHSSQGVIQLVQAIKHGGVMPKLVVFFDGCVDVFAAYHHGGAEPHAYVEAFDAAIAEVSRREPFGYLSRTNLARLVRAKLSPAEDRTTPRAPELAGAIVDTYLKNVELVGALASRYGFAAAFFWQPMAHAGRKLLTEDEKITTRLRNRADDGFPALYGQASTLLRARAVANVHDIGDAFDGARESVYATYCHLAPAGSRIIAARMHEILTARGR